MIWCMSMYVSCVFLTVLLSRFLRVRERERQRPGPQNQENGIWQNFQFWKNNWTTVFETNGVSGLLGCLKRHLFVSGHWEIDFDRCLMSRMPLPGCGTKKGSCFLHGKFHSSFSLLKSLPGLGKFDEYEEEESCWSQNTFVSCIFM